MTVDRTAALAPILASIRQAAASSPTVLMVMVTGARLPRPPKGVLRAVAWPVRFAVGVVVGGGEAVSALSTDGLVAPAATSGGVAVVAVAVLGSSLAVDTLAAGRTGVAGRPPVAGRSWPVPGDSPTVACRSGEDV
jgi:hypothetical protein